MKMVMTTKLYEYNDKDEKLKHSIEMSQKSWIVKDVKELGSGKFQVEYYKIGRW